MPQIIDAYLGLTALRQAGYRSTATAVAELVDNSIEANANNIDIIALSDDIVVSTRTSNQVQQIAVLDDGEGMITDVLENCLSLGWGTRLDTRSGLGRFGFGLKGASISQARKVEVYSWINPDSVYMAYLDLDEIHQGKMQKLSGIIKAELPGKIKTSFGDKISDSGTLVVWDNLDQMDLKRPKTLLARINKELCRIYRHFLDDCDVYGKKRNISLHMVHRQTNKIESITLKANDPLYILTPNNLDGYTDEPTNEYHEEPFTIDVKYHNGFHDAVSKVEFRFTYAKPSIQEKGGKSKVGRHYGDNTGISFVRAGREIDFGSFGFLDASEPRHRWWGAEVRFDPVLDEMFGVTNNKQEVRNIKKYDKDHLDALRDESLEGDYRAAMILEINKILSDHISAMMKVITGRREGTRKRKALSHGLLDRVNQQFQSDSSSTESDQHGSSISEEQKINERIQALLTDDTTLDADTALKEALKTLDYKVDILTDAWPGDLFLDRRPVANASVGIINRNTLFYEKFWRYLEDSEDTKGYQALEIIMAALIRAEDELAVQMDKDTFERYRQKWGGWVQQLLLSAY